MSVIQKNKITKKVWFEGKLWDVVKIFNPTKHHSYILIQRVRNDQVHHGTNIHPINMALIDCGNDEFYPDTDEVKKLMAKTEKSNADLDESTEKLSSIWLTLFKRI